MLDPGTAAYLREGRNLLAFSGGVDSTALFHLLERAGIAFDIAHVNYHTRAQSAAEAKNASAMARQYGKRCFIHDAPAIDRNFEATARRIRYDFFDSLIAQYGYDNLITAHQLDDRLEWLIMQLCKGAGLPEMTGMQSIEFREDYVLVRPLLQQSKALLRQWLENAGLPYFEDESNDDERFRRNEIRHRFAAPLLAHNLEGIAASFRYLDADAAALRPEGDLHTFDTVMIMQTPENRLMLMRLVDRWLKRQGHLMRRGEKERLLKENELVIGRRYALSVGKEHTIVAPYVQTAMPKKFKEHCRTLGIGKSVRPFLFTAPERFAQIKSVLENAVSS